MYYPNDEIRNNIDFIDNKVIDGIALTDEEREYKRDVKYFMEVYDNVVLSQELLDLKLNLTSIIHYVNEIETKVIKVIEINEDVEKKKSFNKILKKLEYIKVKGIKYIKSYVIDNYPRTKHDLNSFIKWFEKNDDYIKSIMKKHKDCPFYTRNHYTGEIIFNDTMIDLSRQILGGDIKLYNKIDKIVRIISKNPNKKEELLTELPENINKVSLEELSIILSYGNIDNSKYNFSKQKNALAFMSAFQEVKKGKYIGVHKFKIEKYVMHVIDLIVANHITEEQLSNLEVLNYFDHKTDPSKFRLMLLKANYDLDEVVKMVKDDDMIARTSLSRKGSLLFDRKGLNFKNIYLLSEYANGNISFYRDLKAFYETGNEKLLRHIPEDIIGAEISTVDRAAYLQPFSKINSHEYDKDKYDLRVLQAISMYKHSLEKK